MIQVVLNDRLGIKLRVKCNDDDTIRDLKRLDTGIRCDEVRIEAERRTLSENERGMWLETRKRWEDKEREYGIRCDEVRIEAERRTLSENERGMWLETRKRWEDKEREYGLLVNGEWCEDHAVIKAEMASHYRRLFSKMGKSCPIL
nr:ubiquitin-like protein 5 [Tanacetum cinerariifolium]